MKANSNEVGLHPPFYLMPQSIPAEETGCRSGVERNTDENFYSEDLKKLAQMQKMWALRKPVLDAHIVSLQKDIQKLEGEIDGIVMERLRNTD